jgi:hypothetical protein
MFQKTPEELARAKQVAETIKEQINNIDSRAFWVWAARDFKYSAQEGLGSLIFKISGCTRVKGTAYVKIVLTGSDEYNVIVYKSHTNTKIINSSKGVYCFQLVDVINIMVG